MSLTLPNIYVEAGLLPDSPTAPGSSFNLGTSLLGTGTLGASIIWSDISTDVIRFTVTRVSTRVQGPLWNYQPGTVSILLDNSAGTYDMDNVSGPFYGLLSPMVPVRVRADNGGTAYQVYNGFADGWFPSDVTYEGDYAELTLSATDAFKVLANVIIPASTIEGVNADTGARVKDILNRSGWYSTAEYRLIDTGNSLLQGTTLGDNALALMQLAVDSEIGQLYVNGAGAVVFRARHALLTDTRSNVVQAVFGDSPGTSHTAGTELRMSGFTRTDDDTTIVNDVQATISGSSSVQAVQDSASVTKYLFPRSYQRTDLILLSDADALSWAQWVLFVGKSDENRIETLTINPQSDPVNLWPQVLGREIGDRIQIWIRPAGVTTPISKDAFIAGITHDWISADQQWVTKWTLQSAVKFGSFLTLDNATIGQLDNDALSF